MSVEVHEADDWAAVYLDGKLQRVGDAYLADEWVREHFGVITVQDDAYLRGQAGRGGVAQTLDEVHAYAEKRDALRAEAKRLAAQAQNLKEQAAALMAEAEGKI